MKTLIYGAALFSGLILALLLFVGAKRISNSLSFFEIEPPKITILSKEVRGLGRKPVSFVLSLSDLSSGLDEIVIRVEQNNNSKEVLRKRLEGRKSARITFELAGIDSELEEGHATVFVKAYDRSIWSNEQQASIMLPIDFRAPQLTLLSTQHNSRFGGSQLVVFKPYDESLATTGVFVNDKFFEGLPAQYFDIDFEQSDVFVSLLAIPLSLQNDGGVKDLSLTAADQVGNIRKIPINHKTRSRKIKDRNIEYSEKFLREEGTLLFDNFFRSRPELPLTTPKASRARLIEQFEHLNTKARQNDDQSIRSLLEAPNALRNERPWIGAFLQPTATHSFRFGDKLSFLFGNSVMGSWDSTGYLYLGTSLVKAANNGVVVFSGSIGTYGRTVILDHGFGLFSIYSHLNSAMVREGDRVNKGSPIAKPGRSGLWDSTGFFFEIRVQGEPVDPLEWWDRNWINQHIDKKLAEARSILGLKRPISLR